MACMYVLVNSCFTENPSTWSWLTPSFPRWGCYSLGGGSEGSRSCVFPLECSTGTEVSRRDLQAFSSLSSRSPPRWSWGSAWLAQGRVPCVLVFTSLLLLLLITSVCQANSSGLPGVRMWMHFMAVLDVVSSRFRSRGVTSWIRAKLLVCGPVFSCLFRFSFVFELVAPWLCLCVTLPS
jgi:hypothetical protein